MADDPIRWKKIGGGAFYFHRRIIKPGQIFWAKPSEIHDAHRDRVVPLEEIPAENPEPINIKKLKFKVVPRGKSKVWYDVKNEAGKVINEKALKKESAEKLAQTLS